MSSLTPKARKLVQAGRDALRPSAEDRERVALTLAPQLGAALAGEAASAVSPASAAAKATVAKILAGVVGLGVAGGALVFALRSEIPPAASSAVVPPERSRAAPAKPPPVLASPKPPALADQAPADQAPADDTAVDEAPEAHGTATSAAQHNSVSEPPNGSTSEDGLAQEVAILSRASSALHSGRPAAALMALAEHQQKFPRGILTQERTAARIQALCALGRTTEARAELARLSSKSPLKARARQACGLAPEK